MAVRKFAEFETDGVTVRHVFDWSIDEADPAFEADLPQPLDVTTQDPTPVPGSVYDPEAGTFTAPPTPTPLTP